jgi:hypothetical protein
MSWRHPSKARLLEWLETGTVDEGLYVHVEQCSRCADELEALAEGDLSVDGALAALLSPDTGLEARMSARVASAMRDREDLALMISVLGSGARTARILFDPPPTP